jgi:hypothetical protein
VLEEDRAAVEHLQGMNRFRLGLHIPGNVIVACKRCNGEKRRDDQMPKLKLAETGWESFLNHDSTRCDLGCKTCSRWAALWPDLHERIENLGKTREKIKTFRARYPEALEWSSRIQDSLPHTVEALYRDCQRFAEEQIDKIVDDVLPKVRKQAAAGTQDLG